MVIPRHFLITLLKEWNQDLVLINTRDHLGIEKHYIPESELEKLADMILEKLNKPATIDPDSELEFDVRWL